MDVDEAWLRDYTDISKLVKLYGECGTNFGDPRVVEVLNGTNTIRNLSGITDSPRTTLLGFLQEIHEGYVYNGK